MEKRVLIVLLVVLTIFSLGLMVSVPTSFVEVDGQRFSVSVADSNDERTKGLMFVDDLPSGKGMLFVFGSEDQWSFWMKNTLISLDIIFIAADKTVVDIFHADPCTADPCEVFQPSIPAKYVFEVNKGTFDDSIIGKKVRITV